MRYLLCCLVLALPALSFGAVYKSIQPDGSVIFTDAPRKDSTEVDLPKTQTYTSPQKSKQPAAPDPKAKQPATPKAEAYTQLVILEPGKDATVQPEAEDMTVQVSSAPGLDSQNGHTYALELDGSRVGKPRTKTSFTLQNIDRGTHTVQVHILDGAGKVLKSSDPVIFHLKRHSVSQ